MDDFIAGLVAGTVSLTIGHPIDTIKSVIQTKNQNSIKQAFAFIRDQNKNYLGFFRGLSLPLIGYAPVHSAIFGVYGTTLKYLENGSNRKDPCLKNILISGSVSGCLTSVFVNPLELVKIQLQTHKKSEQKGLLDCFEQIYKNGGLRGFLRGSLIFTVRQTISLGIYFFNFEFSRRKLKELGITNSITKDLIAGGIAGCVSWFLIMPIDIIKTKQQADLNKSLTIRYLAKQIWRTEGVRGLYRGCTPTLVRGFIVNAIILCTYIQTLKFLKNFI